MLRPALLELIKRRPVLCDGGMGTQLIAAGLAPGESAALWNIDRPGVIENVHRRYRAAGCDLVTTNTFQACRQTLAMHGAADRVREVNLAAAANARRGGGDDAIVLGDVGPFGGFLEPVGDTTSRELLAIFVEQLEALHEGGADAAIIETMSDPNELAIAVKAATQVANWPVIATFAFQKGSDGTLRTMMGTTVEHAVNAALEAGADVVGTNCGTDMDLDDYLRLASQLVAVAVDRVPVIVQPNAGAPSTVGGQSVYPAMPDDMAELAARLVEIGVGVVGGCCGTTPDHLAAMAKALGEV